ncbi:MAG: hypothetical protein NTU97_03270 [Candidatus Magasanikbacteria bacterium]|nr:hypothetical protein [Candidatus Magasanikbacteria bacterium]
MDVPQRTVVSDHALARFFKHSAKMGRCYSSELEAREDLLERFKRSQFIDTTFLRQGEKRRLRYPDSLNFLEDKEGTKTPMIFIGKSTTDYRHRQVLLIITCFPFKGGSAGRSKPKTRDDRARSKRRWKNLIQETGETTEE